MASKCNVRSISLPSRSHPSTVRVEEELNKLNTWEATSSCTSESIGTGLTLLEDSYICLDDLLNMTSTQQVISRHRGEYCLEELLDGSVKILDFCGITRDMMFQIKEKVQALHSALRRRKGDSSIETSVAEYNFFLKKMRKNAKKLMMGLKQMDSRFGASPVLNQDHHLVALVRVVREVIAMNICIFQSLLSFLAVPVSKPKGTKWLAVARLMHKGVIACEENSENVNELQSVESALSSLSIEGCNNVEKMQGAHERLEALEIGIEGLENGLESVFRRLIKTRASLLNIISQ